MRDRLAMILAVMGLVLAVTAFSFSVHNIKVDRHIEDERTRIASDRDELNKEFHERFDTRIHNLIGELKGKGIDTRDIEHYCMGTIDDTTLNKCESSLSIAANKILGE